MANNGRQSYITGTTATNVCNAEYRSTSDQKFELQKLHILKISKHRL